MKVVCVFLVLLTVFGALEASPRFREKITIQTPFYMRQRIINPTIVGGNPGRIEDFPHHLGIIDLTFGG
jgi:hypothetical protein